MFIQKSNHTRFITTTIFMLTLAACTDDGSSMDSETGSETDETGGEMAVAIVGTYMDEFGDTHMISETEWTNSAGSFAISQWDNDEMWLVAQNAETNMYNPGQWSRFDWTWDGEQLYYCQSVYDGTTIDDALAGSADASDLLMGCGMFAWTRLNP
jgi:hypothetical protein